MAHFVKCLICQQSFDRDTTPCTKVGRRYQHETCPSGWEKKIDETDTAHIERRRLTDCIDVILGKEANWGVIGKQIQDYLEQGYTYQGMLATLIYYYNYRSQSIENTIGIGIIPYYYNDAKEYYANRKRVMLENREKDMTPKENHIIELDENTMKKKSSFKSFWKDDE